MEEERDGEPIHLIPKEDVIVHSETPRCECKPYCINEREMHLDGEPPIYQHRIIKDRLN
jgi:hypothetical protein